MAKLKRSDVLRRLIFGRKLPKSWQLSLVKRGWENIGAGEFIGDKEIYEAQAEYKCQVCGVVTPDIRHLTLDCFYELHEVSPKFKMTKLYLENGDWKWVYTILICKGCRSVFMFDFLTPFIEQGGELRKSLGIDDDGIIALGG